MLERMRPQGTRYIATSAWVYLALCAGVLAIAALRSDPVVGVIVGGTLLVLCSPFYLRAGVYVTDVGLTCVPVSGTQSRYDWPSIRAFNVAPVETELRRLGVYVQLMDGRKILLPTTQGSSRSRVKVEHICQALEAARVDAHALHPPVPVDLSPSVPEPMTVRRFLKQAFWDTRETKVMFMGVFGSLALLTGYMLIH